MSRAEEKLHRGDCAWEACEHCAEHIHDSSRESGFEAGRTAAAIYIESEASRLFLAGDDEKARWVRALAVHIRGLKA